MYDGANVGMLDGWNDGCMTVQMIEYMMVVGMMECGNEWWLECVMV